VRPFVQIYLLIAKSRNSKRRQKLTLIKQKKEYNLHRDLSMDVVNLHVASELEDESQDSSGRGKAGAVSRSVTAHAANVGIGAEIEKLARQLKKKLLLN
jgi:hypothetical protein